MAQRSGSTTSPEMPAWFLDRWLECALIPRGFGMWRIPAGWDTRRAYRKDYELYLVRDGSMRTRANAQSWELQANDALLMSPGMPFHDHDGALGRGTHLIGLRFSVASGNAFDPLTTLGLPAAVSLRRPQLVNRMADAVVRYEGERPMARPRQRLRVRSLLDLLLGEFLVDGFAAQAFTAVASDPLPLWLRHVLAFIERRLDLVHLQVSDLAVEAGLSESHFAHRFQHYLHVSPKRWLQRRRIAKARTLLISEPCLRINDIAERCGFADPFHFSRAFSRRMGVAPSHWRQQVLAAADSDPSD